MGLSQRVRGRPSWVQRQPPYPGEWKTEAFTGLLARFLFYGRDCDSNWFINYCTLHLEYLPKSAFTSEMCILGFFFNFLMFIYFWERKRDRVRVREGQRERERESEAGSRLWAVSTEPNEGLELTNCEIMAWAEVGRSTDWATQVPHEMCISKRLYDLETIRVW